MNLENTLEILAALCECAENRKCLICAIKDTMEEMNDHLEIAQKAVNIANERHNLHIDALNAYWHQIHKDCPCLTPPGKCKSPWETIQVDSTEPQLTRSEELNMIEEFLKGKK